MSARERLCLSCKEIFTGRSDSPDQMRCSVCHTREIMDKADYDNIKDDVLDWMRKTPFGIVPVWDIARVVIGKRDMNRPASFTLELMKTLYDDIVLGKPPTLRRSRIAVE